MFEVSGEGFEGVLQGLGSPFQSEHAFVFATFSKDTYVPKKKPSSNRKPLPKRNLVSVPLLNCRSQYGFSLSCFFSCLA